jgi:hypothetical protein
MRHYGIATDYDRNAGRKRDYLTVWTGPFASEYVASGVSLPKGDGYMLSILYGGKVRVACPTPRTDENFAEIDAAIGDAVTAYYNEK